MRVTSDKELCHYVRSSDRSRESFCRFLLPRADPPGSPHRLQQRVPIHPSYLTSGILHAVLRAVQTPCRIPIVLQARRMPCSLLCLHCDPQAPELPYRVLRFHELRHHRAHRRLAQSADQPGGASPLVSLRFPRFLQGSDDNSGPLFRGCHQGRYPEGPPERFQVPRVFRI